MRGTMTKWVVALVLLPILGAAASTADAQKQSPFTVKVVGKGRPMILIPGLMCSGDVWDTTVEHYKSSYECHVLTLAGFAGRAAGFWAISGWSAAGTRRLHPRPQAGQAGDPGS